MTQSSNSRSLLTFSEIEKLYGWCRTDTYRHVARGDLVTVDKWNDRLIEGLAIPKSFGGSVGRPYVPNQQYCSVPAAAQALSITKRQVVDLLAMGEIRGRLTWQGKTGFGRTLICVRSLAAFIRRGDM